MSRQIPSVAIPTAIARRLRFEPGAFAVVSHHAIGFELEQIIDVQILRML